jgi:phosphoglucomutase
VTSVSSSTRAPAARRLRPLSEQIFAASREVSEYRIAELPDFDLARTGVVEIEGFAIEVVDSTRDYADLMETLFDFDRMRDWLSGSGRICFDSLHAVTGPYAQEILIRRLGAPAASVMHANPLPDFGGVPSGPESRRCRAPDRTLYERWLSGPDRCIRR